MHAIKVLLRNKTPKIFGGRYYATSREKITDFDEETLPVFQYPISKTSDRNLYSWGLAETGALGIHMPRGKKGRKQYRNNFSLCWYPMRSEFAERFDVEHVATGYGFTVASIKTDEQHKVFGTGINTDSQIGYHAPRMGHPLELLLSPAPIFLPYKSLETKIIGIDAGRAHTAILTDNEGVYTLGNNAYGQCGRKINSNEEYKGSVTSHNIKKLGGQKITSVCCGQDHTLFITESGRVFACGWGADGQTGLGTYENRAIPAEVKGDITTEKIVKVASTGDCVLALNNHGELFGWGNSEYGQIPMRCGSQQVNMSYSLRDFCRGLGKITDIAAGGSFCLIVNG
uniref:Uncharacterized protein n=1 Tax=Heliothis virescens TaxID=7102 RepID=A0A2A4J9T2_HELVI